MVHWLVEDVPNQGMEEETEAFVVAARAQGHSVTRFGAGRLADLGGCIGAKYPTSLRGCLRTLREAAHHCPDIVLFESVAALRCSEWLPRFGEDALNSDYIMLAAGDLLRREDELFDRFGTDKLFLRPNRADKPWSGMLVERVDWGPSVLHLVVQQTTEIAVVASAKPIEAEWRLVIVEQEVVAGSAYEPEEGPVPARVLEHAGELMDREFCPDDVWTLDLCESDGRILVVETNSFSGAGLYQCDMDTVVRAVSRIIERDWAGSRIAVG